MERLGYFLAKPKYINAIPVYSPTLDQVADLTEPIYWLYYTVATFNVKNLLEHYSSLSQEQIQNIVKELDAYEIATATPNDTKLLSDTIAFFCRVDEVVYDQEHRNFTIDGKVVVSEHNYKEFAKIVASLNGRSLIEEKKTQKKATNATTQAILDRMEMYEKQLREKTVNSQPTLKDLASKVVTMSEGGISVFNVGQLTIYQLYERLAELSDYKRYQDEFKLWVQGRQFAENHKLKPWGEKKSKL